MAVNTRLYFLMILNMKTAIYLFFLLFAFRGLAAEKYYIRVDSKTSYAEVYDEYVRIISEKGNDCNIQIKIAGLPPFELHASVLCPASHRFCLYIRKNYTVLCWLEYINEEPLVYDGYYNPGKIMKCIREVVRRKNYDVGEAIEFIVYPESIDMPVEQHAELLQQLSVLSRNRVTYVQIRAYPRKL